ncbi:GNAT family N-acetyltransferase [Gordonia sp. (in: high G+C Gram-positive bacteria)]|uniref:GNAT family N-acetyltransferase n=1 Tax=Gordonia sp. (in: high G+C Gram-positive bacteria) TaxID=84139 RepID=UPI0016B46502|nr:GNAT family N-acetyltransferase [Gordonia sp. (in: high G+C Gram-positive bacteria)]NLG47888.1 N-acetyltransferase [Gordonia sp. (in: high G+C Gram-positive bacteria)]
MADGILEVTHLFDQERYRAVLKDGDNEAVEVGYVDYTQDGDRLALTHTVVYERFGGRGLAAQLVKHVLEDVRSNGQVVVPVCSYVQKYVEKHPEYSDIVAV